MKNQKTQKVYQIERSSLTGGGIFLISFILKNKMIRKVGKKWFPDKLLLDKYLIKIKVK